MIISNAERVAMSKLINMADKFRSKYGRDVAVYAGDGHGTAYIFGRMEEEYEFAWGEGDGINGYITEKGEGH